MEITKRVRVNISTSVKGIKTHDSTFEITMKEDGSETVDALLQNKALRDVALQESDALVAELEKRYPIMEGLNANTK